MAKLACSIPFARIEMKQKITKLTQIRPSSLPFIISLNNPSIYFSLRIILLYISK